MKKVLLILGITILILVGGYFVFMRYTKSFSPATTVYYNKNGLTMEVEYSRPSKKGRVIFGDLVPYGEVWRTGANEATLFKVSKDIMLAGRVLRSGSYTLFTIPGKDQWTVIVNGESGQWGLSYNEAKDVLRVTVPAQTTEQPTEMFTIAFEDNATGTSLVLLWDQTRVQVPISILQ